MMENVKLVRRGINILSSESNKLNIIQSLPGTYPLGRREAGGICGHLQSEEGQDVLKRFAEAESSRQLMTYWRDVERC